jgi:hypothetical protein
MDNGSEFGVHKIHEIVLGTLIQETHWKTWNKADSRRVKHPQTNGKLERWVQIGF